MCGINTAYLFYPWNDPEKGDLLRMIRTLPDYLRMEWLKSAPKLVFSDISWELELFQDMDSEGQVLIGARQRERVKEFLEATGCLELLYGAQRGSQGDKAGFLLRWAIALQDDAFTKSVQSFLGSDLSLLEEARKRFLKEVQEEEIE